MKVNTNLKNTKRSYYLTVHQYLHKKFGKSKSCDNGCKNQKKYEWCLKKGKEYAPQRENFLRLCTTCHHIYDKIPIGHGANQGELHYRARLNNKDVEIIRKMSKNGFPNKVIAKRFKISCPHISMIINKKKWKHVL